MRTGEYAGELWEGRLTWGSSPEMLPQERTGIWTSERNQGKEVEPNRPIDMHSMGAALETGPLPPLWMRFLPSLKRGREDGDVSI